MKNLFYLLFSTFQIIAYAQSKILNLEPDYKTEITADYSVGFDGFKIIIL
jgi:hypothetical protein